MLGLPCFSHLLGLDRKRLAAGNPELLPGQVDFWGLLCTW
jgi:hypothetical protein